MEDDVPFGRSAKESLKKTVCDYKTHIAEIIALQNDTTKCLNEIQDLIEASLRSQPLLSLPELQVPDFNFVQRLPCVLFIGTQNCGKTTLLNVFLGKHILPTHENPCTARLVRMVHSSSNENYVTLVNAQGQKQEIKKFKDKVPKKYIVLKDGERQDGEKLNTIVEVGVKGIKLLECGIELIDSPGRNENEALDRVTEEFISKGVVPLIVYVVDGNMQLQQTDRTTIRELQNKFPNVSLMFVCSKVDIEQKAKDYDKDDDEGNSDDDTHDPFDEELFKRAQKKKYEVHQKLKTLEFIPSDDEIGTSRLFHGVSAKMVKLSLKKNFRNAATMSFENLELCIFEKLESSLRKESKKALSILLSIQEMILTSVVDRERTLAVAMSSAPNAYDQAVGIELSLFSLILELIVKRNSITKAIGFELEKLAVIFINEGEKYQFKAKSKMKDADLVEEFCSEIKGSILDRTFNVLKRSVKRDLRRSLFTSARNAELAKSSIESALMARFFSRAYGKGYDKEENPVDRKRLAQTCAVLEGILESFSTAIDVALRKELSRHLRDFDLKEVGKPKPKESSWRGKVVQAMLSKINCNLLGTAVVLTCKEALSIRHQEFMQDARKFHLLNKMLSSPGVESMVKRLRTDYVPQVAELAVKGHALQYVIERCGSPELGKEEMCTAHGQVHSCSSPLWCADRNSCLIKVVTKSAVGPEVWNQTMLDCMHTKDIVETLGTCCPYFLQLNGWFLPEPDKLYIVMEEAKEDLLAALKRGMPWEKRLRVAIDVAEGVSAIHKAHYVYQDLKPQNVMLTADGTAKVNLCKPEKPMENTKLGIPFHISPRMFRNYKKGVYSENNYDIYAFGSLLWVLCEGSGQAPPQVYSHCHDIEAMENAVCKGIRPERPPHTPDACWDLMNLCWKEDTSNIQIILDRLIQIHFRNTCTLNG